MKVENLRDVVLKKWQMAQNKTDSYENMITASTDREERTQDPGLN